MVSRVSWVARHQPGSLDRHWSTSWGISGSADFCCQHLNSFYLRASRHCIDWCGQCLQTYLSMCIVDVTVCMKQYFDHFSEHYLVENCAVMTWMVAIMMLRFLRKTNINSKPKILFKSNLPVGHFQLNFKYLYNWKESLIENFNHQDNTSTSMYGGAP